MFTVWITGITNMQWVLPHAGTMRGALYSYCHVTPTTLSPQANEEVETHRTEVTAQGDMAKNDTQDFLNQEVNINPTQFCSRNSVSRSWPPFLLIRCDRIEQSRTKYSKIKTITFFAIHFSKPVCYTRSNENPRNRTLKLSRIFGDHLGLLFYFTS